MSQSPDIKTVVEMNHHKIEELYEKNWQELVSFVQVRMQSSREYAEDIAGDIFLKVMVGAKTYQEQGFSTGWLYTIARNHMIDVFRRNSAAKRAGVGPDIFANRFPSGDIFESQVDDKLLLAEELKKLTPDRQEIIKTRFLDDRSIADTASRLGKQPESVKKAQMFGLRQLKRTINAVISDSVSPESANSIVRKNLLK